MSPPQSFPERAKARVAVERYAALDGWRGLACCIVIFDHIVPMLGAGPYFQSSILLRPLMSGPAMLYGFFVMSGFVLWFSFVVTDKLHVRAFFAKRVLRIYPPLAVAVALAAVAFVLVRPAPVAGLSVWFNKIWVGPLTWQTIWTHLALTDAPLWLDPPLWSLVVEARLSLLFPLIVFAVRRFPASAGVASLALSLLCIHFATQDRQPTLFDPLVTGPYVFLFAAGALIAMQAERLHALGERLGPVASYGLLLAVVVLVCIPTSAGHGLPALLVAPLLVASIAFVPRIARPFEGRVLRAIGQMSYSVYVLHMIAFLAVVHALDGVVPTFVAIGLAVALTFAGAAVMFRLVERPSLHAGRRLAKRLRGG